MRRLKYLFIAGLVSIALGIAGISMSTPKAVLAADAPVACSDASQASDCDPGKVTESDAPCGGGDFLGLPKWYKYLKSQQYQDGLTGAPNCSPVLSGFNDVWKIVAAVIELLTRLATLIAIGFVVYGGVTYVISQGNPDKTKQALKTVINALVGLVITIISTAVVSYIAGRF